MMGGHMVFSACRPERVLSVIITQADVTALLQPLTNRLAACLRAGFGVQLCSPPLPRSIAILAHQWSIVNESQEPEEDMSAAG